MSAPKTTVTLSASEWSLIQVALENHAAKCFHDGEASAATSLRDRLGDPTQLKIEAEIAEEERNECYPPDLCGMYGCQHA